MPALKFSVHYFLWSYNLRQGFSKNSVNLFLKYVKKYNKYEVISINLA